MEALAALGVAAASVQFLDFALQALSLCRQIRDDAQGATAANKELESYSRSIKDLSKELKSGQADNASGRRIKAVAQACTAKTEELLALLDRVRKAGSNSRTAAAKTLFRSLKERREIEKLQNQLKEKQALLDSALIQDIQRRFDLGSVKQDENFTSLKQSIQDLVNSLQDQVAVAQQNHAETHIKLTNLAKDSQILRATTVAGHSKTVQRLDQIHEDIGQGFDKLKISDAKEQFVRSLFYPEHAARREMVKPPWSNTFDWIFDETFESPACWSSFPAWLKCASSLYWITGKPASGKSTLMAHIFHDPRTATYLEQWSCGRRLHVLSFFFWRPGSALQKSICGLLRSLIMQLADDVPGVAPAILAGLHLRPGRMPTWSERGLTDALRLALTAAKDIYLCFLLDGLDEFDGPYGELVDLIFEMKDSKNVKFCVSSRREAGLANRLCQYDHLSMENLNSDAIRTYAQDKLSPVTDAKALSKEIAHRSQGVFLWAVLTTQSLLHGAFDCSEDVDMLHRRLESTPDEMIQLFGQILATVDKVHKEQLYIWMRLLSLKVNPTVAELAIMRMPDCATTYDVLSAACQLTRKHIDYFSRGLLCVDVWPPWEETDQLWHAPEMTQGAKITSSAILSTRKTEVIASRTFGEGDQAMKTVHKASRSRIEFLHRSLLDFVADNSVRSVLGLGNLPRDLDFILDYFQACLVFVAVCPHERWVPNPHPSWKYVERFIETLSEHSILLGTNTRSILDELLTLACAFSDRELSISEVLELEDVFPHMTPELQRLTTVEQSFFFHCVLNGLFEYVRRGIHRFFGRDDEGYCMARIAWFDPDHASDPNSLRLPMLLLESLRDQLSFDRSASDVLEPRRLFWKKYFHGTHSEWFVSRVSLGNKEAKTTVPLSLATAGELWNNYNHFIEACPEGMLRHNIILLLIELMSILDVGIGAELLPSPYRQLVLFVSPSAFWLPFGKPDKESSRLLHERWSTLQRSMHFGWQNPLRRDVDDICSYEVPRTIADKIFKRWIDEEATWEKSWHWQYLPRYGDGPSSNHVSDQDIDALVGDVWASETIDSWQQLYLLALLRKWRRQREQVEG
ncbi:hypothetical protein D0865_10421 [Hortaea werneckii]|uniref:NACHT domain-containing protein n=1 Tax=Hortaea werneckii TaxID=91943 RepID=A0A3M7BXY4_HORWE|nr:hypothetical protein D0865_10421 [Hortaea werneckii]